MCHTTYSLFPVVTINRNRLLRATWLRLLPLAAPLSHGVCRRRHRVSCRCGKIQRENEYKINLSFLVSQVSETSRTFCRAHFTWRIGGKQLRRSPPKNILVFYIFGRFRHKLGNELVSRGGSLISSTADMTSKGWEHIPKDSIYTVNPKHSVMSSSTALATLVPDIRGACQSTWKVFASISSIRARQAAGTHLFRIDGYSTINAMVPAGTAISSGTFHAGGHKWKLNYFPNGTSTIDAGKQKAIYFPRGTSTVDAGKQKTVSVELSLEDKSLAMAGFRVSILDRAGIPAYTASGKPCLYKKKGNQWHWQSTQSALRSFGVRPCGWWMTRTASTCSARSQFSSWTRSLKPCGSSIRHLQNYTSCMCNVSNISYYHAQIIAVLLEKCI